MESEDEKQVYRVTYVTSGGRRRTRTLDEATTEWLKGATGLGLRVTSSRKATDREIERGIWTGMLNK